MRLSAADMITFADYFSIAHDYRPHHRVGGGTAIAATGKLQATGYIQFIFGSRFV
jgi:hypothetical protein